MVRRKMAEEIIVFALSVIEVASVIALVVGLLFVLFENTHTTTTYTLEDGTVLHNCNMDDFRYNCGARLENCDEIDTTYTCQKNVKITTKTKSER